MPTTPFRIKPKRDFGSGPGHFIDGHYVTRGFVVTDGFCNIMPAAIWFQTIPEAMDAIDIYCGVHGDGCKFWETYRLRA